MTKIVIISACQDCPHASHAGVCLHPDILDDNNQGQRLTDEILKSRTIPSWCPLEDDWISVEEQEPEDTGYFEIWLSPLWDNLSPRLDTATWVGAWSKEFAGYEITHWRRARGPQ